MTHPLVEIVNNGRDQSNIKLVITYATTELYTQPLQQMFVKIHAGQPKLGNKSKSVFPSSQKPHPHPKIALMHLNGTHGQYTINMTESCMVTIYTKLEFIILTLDQSQDGVIGQSLRDVLLLIYIQFQSKETVSITIQLIQSMFKMDLLSQFYSALPIHQLDALLMRSL
jgi:hypothetical protein